MVQRDKSLGLGIEFEHREIHHPQRLPSADGQRQIGAELQAQRAEGVVDHPGLVGAEEDEVAVLRARPAHDAGDGLVREELQDRRLQSLAPFGRVVDLDIRQPLGAKQADMNRVLVDLAAREFAALRHAQGRHTPSRIAGRTGKDLELATLDQVGDVDQFERIAQVRLVGSKAAYRLGVGQARDRIGQIHVQHRPEQRPDHRFHQGHHALLVEKRGFNVELGEFRLPVGAQVFVAETTRKLVVALEAGHHQQLFEELRRLRQGKEPARVGARRHQVIARALRRRLGQYRRLDLGETLLLQKGAQGLDRAMAQAQVALHDIAAQIEVAVTQAHRLGQFAVVVLERQRLRPVEDFERAGGHLHLAGRQVRILGAGRTMAHLAGDAQHIFVAHALGERERLALVRIEHRLQQTGTIAQVDENHPAVVTATMGPTAQGHGLADVRFIYFTAIVAAHGKLERMTG